MSKNEGIYPYSKVKVGFRVYTVIKKDKLFLNDLSKEDKTSLDAGRELKDNPELLGRWDGDQDCILMLSSLKPSNRVRVLMHEILHAIEDQYSLEFSESDIDRVACGIVSLMKDNPELIKSMMKDLS